MKKRYVLSSQSTVEDVFENPVPHKTNSVSVNDTQSFNLKHMIEEDVDDISEQFGKLKVSDKINAHKSNECKKVTLFTRLADTSHNDKNSEENGNTLLLDDYIIIDETLPTTDATTIGISSTDLTDISSASFGSCTSNKSQYSSRLTSVILTFKDVILDFNAHSLILSSTATNDDDFVETLIIGDYNVKHIKIHAGSPSKGSRKTYKVAKVSSCISEMTATTEYLLRERFKNIKKVILHLGTNDIKIKGSEEIRRGLKNFCDMVTNKFEKQLIVSGPLMTMSMKSESFSRAFAINTWLATAARAREIEISFVDNFHLFWGKEHFLFQRDHKTLNRVGAAVLSNNILCNIDCASFSTLEY